MANVNARLDNAYYAILDRVRYYQHLASIHLQAPITSTYEAHTALENYALALLDAYSPQTQQKLLVLWNFVNQIAWGERDPREGIPDWSNTPEHHIYAYRFTFDDARTTLYFNCDGRNFATVGLSKQEQNAWIVGNIDLDLARFPLHLRLNALHELFCHVAHLLELQVYCPDIPADVLKAYSQREHTYQLMEMAASLVDQSIYAAIAGDVYEEDIRLGMQNMRQRLASPLRQQTIDALEFVHKAAKDTPRQVYVALGYYRNKPDTAPQDVDYLLAYEQHKPMPARIVPELESDYALQENPVGLVFAKARPQPVALLPRYDNRGLMIAREAAQSIQYYPVDRQHDSLPMARAL